MAVPNDGYVFEKWDDGLETAARTDKNIKSSITYTALFKPTSAVEVEWKNPFTDVKTDDWFYNSIKYVNSLGIMNGTETDKFSPNTEVTRAMVATVLGRMNGVDANGEVSDFDDVPINEYYSPYIKWCRDNGIVKGVGDNKFEPNRNVTREELATILTNYLTYTGNGPIGDWMINLTYVDKNKISDWAIEGVSYSTIKGLFKGDENNMFNPQDYATRAEFASTIQRLK